MTSGAFAEDEDIAGTEPGDGGISVGFYPSDDPVIDLIYVTDPLPPEYAEDGVVEGQPDSVDDTGDGDLGTEGSDVAVAYDFGPESECGGCEYQSSAGPVMWSTPGGEMVQRSGGDVVQRAVRRSASASTTAVKDSCLDPERYVAWMCDWQKDLGLISR